MDGAAATDDDDDDDDGVVVVLVMMAIGVARPATGRCYYYCRIAEAKVCVVNVRRNRTDSFLKLSRRSPRTVSAFV